MCMSGPGRLVQREQAKSIWDPDETVQLLYVISVTRKAKTKMGGCHWCLLEDSSLIQARHELMISGLVPLTPVVTD